MNHAFQTYLAFLAVLVLIFIVVGLYSAIRDAAETRKQRRKNNNL